MTFRGTRRGRWEVLQQLGDKGITTAIIWTGNHYIFFTLADNQTWQVAGSPGTLVWERSGRGTRIFQLPEAPIQ